MENKNHYTTQQLKDEAIVYFTRHQNDLEEIRLLLEIKLKKICALYTANNNLPQDALSIKTRVKELDSFLKKLERKNWPQFYGSAAVINDLVGARITCWFLDDCTSILESIQHSGSIDIINTSRENYIDNPKPTGYRALHALANINYDYVKPGSNGKFKLETEKIICEIQIRTRLQDAWGDITHDIYYRTKNLGLHDKKHERFLAAISKRLLKEDTAFLKLKKIYSKFIEQKIT